MKQDKHKLQARDKKVQHMSRDGLVEENLTQKTSQLYRIMTTKPDEVENGV